MSLREQDFNPNTSLWPPSTVDGGQMGGVPWPPYQASVHPIGLRSLEGAYANGLARGLDMGDLQVQNGIWMVLRIGGQVGYWWEEFDPARHLAMANGRRRLRPGYSFGDPRADDGMNYRLHYKTVFGRELDDQTMEAVDIVYDASRRDWLANEFQKRSAVTTPPVTPTPTIPTPDPVTPMPPVTPPTTTPIDLGARLAEAEATIARLWAANERQTKTIGEALAALQSVKNIAERDLASIPNTGGGRPAIEARAAHRKSLTKIIDAAKQGGAL